MRSSRGKQTTAKADKDKDRALKNALAERRERRRRQLSDSSAVSSSSSTSSSSSSSSSSVSSASSLSNEVKTTPNHPTTAASNANTTTNTTATTTTSSTPSSTPMLAYGLAFLTDNLKQVQLKLSSNASLDNPVLPPIKSNSKKIDKDKEDLDALFLARLQNVEKEMDLSTENNDSNNSTATPTTTTHTPRIKHRRVRLVEETLSDARLDRIIANLATRIDHEMSSNESSRSSNSSSENEAEEEGRMSVEKENINNTHSVSTSTFSSYPNTFGFERGLPPKIPWKSFNNPTPSHPAPPSPSSTFIPSNSPSSPSSSSSSSRPFSESFMHSELGPPRSRAVTGSKSTLNSGSNLNSGDGDGHQQFLSSSSSRLVKQSSLPCDLDSTGTLNSSISASTTSSSTTTTFTLASTLFGQLDLSTRMLLERVGRYGTKTTITANGSASTLVESEGENQEYDNDVYGQQQQDYDDDNDDNEYKAPPSTSTTTTTPSTSEKKKKKKKKKKSGSKKNKSSTSATLQEDTEAAIIAAAGLSVDHLVSAVLDSVYGDLDSFERDLLGRDSLNFGGDVATGGKAAATTVMRIDVPSSVVVDHGSFGDQKDGKGLKVVKEWKDEDEEAEGDGAQDFVDAPTTIATASSTLSTKLLAAPSTVVKTRQATGSTNQVENNKNPTPQPTPNSFSSNATLLAAKSNVPVSETVVPEWQRIIFSSVVEPRFYADLIDDVVRALGYELYNIFRKPDVYPSTLTPFCHPRRPLDFHNNHNTTGEVNQQQPHYNKQQPPCTKSSLHLHIRKTPTSIPLTPTKGLSTLYKTMQLNPQQQNSKKIYITVTTATAPPPPTHHAYRHNDVAKSIARLLRAETYGAYHANPIQIPQVVCILARGGFGVPLLRTIVDNGGNGIEFVGLKYVKALEGRVARVVTPFVVGGEGWMESLEFLSEGSVNDVMEGVEERKVVVEKVPVYNEDEDEWGPEEEEEEGKEEEEVPGETRLAGQDGPGWMVIAVRGFNAFNMVDSLCSGFLESYYSMNRPSATATPQELKLMQQQSRLSILPSLNPQQSYAMLTTFFRDADLIPSPPGSLVPQENKSSKNLYKSPDDPEYVPNPAAIPLSLVSPPRGGYGFVVLKPQFGYFPGFWNELTRRDKRNERAFIVCGVRYLSLSEGLVGRMDDVRRGYSENGGEDDGEVGEEENAFGKWVGGAGGVGLVIVFWGVCVMKQLKDMLSDFVVKPQQLYTTKNKRSQNQYQHHASPKSLLSTDLYIPCSNACTQRQLHVLFPRPQHLPTSFAVEVRDFPSQLGCFQRKIITRRPVPVPAPERRVTAMSGSGTSGLGICAVVLVAKEACVELFMEEWGRVLKGLFETVTGARVVGWNYLVASQALAERMVSCCTSGGDGDGGDGGPFSVHNILNGPCMVIVFEGSRDALESIKTRATAAAGGSEEQSHVCLNHQESMSLIPLVFGELIGSFGFRVGIVPPPQQSGLTGAAGVGGY
ncbi:UNVERIFIED_CONTAM: hypothetical protein HDU68_010764 [Siphonaria sp. JEL0065]|nr:hypothetical protein HDU68_010764 [Siphonaria sp. JEL0065]